MTWEIFIGISALVAFVIAIMTPLMKLNANITKLNCTMENLLKKSDSTEKRLVKHGEQIDDHEHRLTFLEAHEEAAHAAYGNESIS